MANRMRKSEISLELVREWVAEAGQVALSHRGRSTVQIKEDRTPVTPVDQYISTLLTDRITQHYPDQGILDEERVSQVGNEEYTWAIDPIDGTRAYASGLPIWGVSVGILRRGIPYAGVFFMPAVGEMYWADETGAFCNDRPLPRHDAPHVDDALHFLAVPSNAHLRYEIDCPRVRSFGSTAAHLIYVACGAAIGALLRPVHIWDIAGVLPLLGHQGIVLVYRSGRALDLQTLLDGSAASGPLVAAHITLVERVLRAIHTRA